MGFGYGWGGCILLTIVDAANWYQYITVPSIMPQIMGDFRENLAQVLFMKLPSRSLRWLFFVGEIIDGVITYEK